MEIRYVPIIWKSISMRQYNTLLATTGTRTALEASDSTALNATVLPMLMSETMHTKMAVATIALAGTWKRG